jgi:hypothetical protein
VSAGSVAPWFDSPMVLESSRPKLPDHHGSQPCAGLILRAVGGAFCRQQLWAGQAANRRAEFIMPRVHP